MRIALVVGVDYYDHGSPLFGCVNDASSVAASLERDASGDVNFSCRLLTGADSSQRVERGFLKDQIQAVFTQDAEIALFYFAGHGHIEASGGYLLATDSARGDEGVSLSEILNFANRSPAKNRIIILDSCHSGIAGSPPHDQGLASLAEGTTVLTASTKDQYSSEENGRGIFTTLLVDALGGSAANLTGDITPGSVYAHIDQSLGPWEQRPVFKTNVKRFVSLKKTTPPIAVGDLRRITHYFPYPNSEYSLDPTYEPEMKGRDPGMPLPDPQNTEIFAILQQYNRLNLLLPVGTQHMWNAAMEGKSCRLTPLGEHYHRLVEKNRI